jgi:hypothetical protein
MTHQNYNLHRLSKILRMTLPVGCGGVEEESGNSYISDGGG